MGINPEAGKVGVMVGVIAVVGVSVGMGVSVGVTCAACTVIVCATAVYTLAILTPVGVGVAWVPPPQALNNNDVPRTTTNRIFFIFISFLFKFNVMPFSVNTTW